jgi:hypothetical protein
VVVLAIAGLIGSSIGMTLVRQQRFYRRTTELLYARQGVRDAMEVLSTDIRGMSTSDSVRVFGDSAIEFFATAGASVVCQSTGNDVGLPAAHSPGNSLSAFLVEPDTGDLALFDADSGTVEHWERHRIANFASRALASSCPSSSGFSQSSEMVGGAPGFVVTLFTGLSGDIKPGAPARFLRRVRYSLYHASDGGWYLGYRRCNAIGTSQCGVVQPVSGPYRAYSRDPAVTGLSFELFDGAGRRLEAGVPAIGVARVDVTARAESEQRIPGASHSARIADSAKVSIAIRNRAGSR